MSITLSLLMLLNEFIWGASTDFDVRYVLVVGDSSRQYNLSVDAGTNLTMSVDLKPMRIYYVSVYAYDANGRRSAFANELVVTNAPPAPNNLRVQDH